MADHSIMIPKTMIDVDEAQAGSDSSRSGSKDVETADLNARPAPLHGRHADPLYGGDVDYKNMAWWHVGMLMIAETISLGVLSLPSSVSHLGLVPGILFIILLGILATYGGYVIGQFKLRHPNVYCMADAGFILFGTFGYHLFCWAALLSLIFIMAAHILTFSVAMNVLTEHGACTMLWMAIGFAISVVLTLPRTLKNVSYFSIASFASIVSAVFLVMISLGVNTHTSAVQADVRLFLPTYTLTPTFLAILNICIAFMGNVAFFGFIAELKDPRDFTKALILLQSVSVSFYVIVGCVIYRFVGTEHMISPALGAASPLIQKIAYGIAMPTIIVAGVINAHVAIKQVYIQLWADWLKQPEVVASKSPKAVLSWIGMVLAQWALALVLSLAIPVFHQLLALISALFGSWFTYGVCGMLWMSMNWAQLTGTGSASEKYVNEWSGNRFWKRMGWKKLALLALNVCMIAVGALLCGVGLYTSILDIISSDTGLAFSCANNAI